MKKENYFMFLFFLLFALHSSAQTIMGCGTKLSEKEKDVFRQSLSKIAIAKKAGLGKKMAATPYVIPVVFHILNDGTNIGNTFTKAQMKSRIDDAIDVCNKDFNGLYPGYNTTDPNFNAVKSKMNIQFVAATIDPDGNLLEYPGMNWHPDVHIVDGYDSRIYNYMYYGKNGKYYLDVVVVDEPNPADGVYGSGHAFLPVQDVLPHVTYNHRYIGQTAGSEASFQFAKEMSHEFGHYFGLQHTFQDGCDPINDGMADTPPTTSAFSCDRTAVNSCGVIANYENLMDYNVNCQAMFTKDQTNAMTYWLEDQTQAKYPRRFLWQTNNLAAVGVNPSVPKANFIASTTAICAGKTITYKDVSVGLPTSRTWTFAGGTPANSTALNPTVSYATAGTYAVTLTVTNSLGTDTKTFTNYIKVNQKLTTNAVENFSGIFPPDGWLITNPDSGLAWEKRNNVGNGDTACMVMNNTDNAVVGALDYIQLPYYNLTSGVNSQLYFDVAYTKFDDVSSDVLDVEVSTNCGGTWTSIYSKTHTVLETATVPKDLSNAWFPTTAANWRKEVINLSAYIGNANVTFRFKNKSGYGTRIWIDNVNVAIVQSATPVSDFAASVRKTNCNSITVPFVDVSTGNPTTWSWSFPGGTPATSTVKNPTVTYSAQGSYAVTLTTTNASGAGTTKSVPNFITVTTPVATSFTEGFEGTFPPANWEITNSKSNLTFEKSTAAGRNSASCMMMNNADNAAGDVDEIMLQPLNLAVGVTDFSFDVAYAKFDKDSPDVLDVLISKDCGVTWTNLYSKTHTVLETAVSAKPNDWIPTLDSEWRTERISLTNFKGNANVLVKFVNTSGYGARVWIDNVKFTFDSKEKPVSDFVISSPLVCSDLPVKFTDISIGEPTSWSWSFPGGIPSTSTAKNPSVVYTTAGNHDVSLVATNTYGTGTSMLKTGVVTIKGKSTLPIVENFAGTFPIQDWATFNIDGDAITWEKSILTGKGDSSCLIINNADAPTDLIDELILKPLDLTLSSAPFFDFDLAYTQYLSAHDVTPVPAPDQIDIFVSSDCGVTWLNVYSKNQVQLQTVSPPFQDDPATTTENETNNWIPTKDSDWRKETIDLSVVKNKPSVLIKIKNTSGFGNFIRFDNFNIVDKSTPTPLVATTSQTEVKCKGGNDGTATVTATGGTGALTYSWSPSGGTLATATGLIAGNYVCTIKDANLVTITKNFTISQPATAITATVSQVGAKCNGGNDGTATVLATGGTGALTYSWSPSGGTLATATGLIAGNYTCTIKDANNCSIPKTITVTQPATAITATVSQVGAKCNGGNDGTATVIATGGTGALTYSWSPSGGTLATATGLIAGNYTCTIKDANNCSISKQIVVTQPTAITATFAKTDVTLYGGTNGTATITASGGTGTLAYSWSPSGGILAKAIGLKAGSYTCIIRDVNNCSVTTEQIVIAQPSAITVSVSQTEVNCNGGNDGTATITATGGIGPFTYLWSPYGGTSSFAAGLIAGDYKCTITDANLNSITQNVTISQPNALDNGVEVVGDKLMANVAGATYQWFVCPNTNIVGETGQSYVPTQSGDYGVVISLNGCSLNSSCVTFSVLGVSDFEKTPKLIVYPNPNKGIFNVKTDIDGEFKVVNILGQTIKWFKVNANTENIINVENLNNGVYFIQGIDNKKALQKIIIKK